MNFKKQRHKSKRVSGNVMSNSERWRIYGKRISRKDDFFDNDSDDDEPQYNEIKGWVQNFFEGKNVNLDKSDEDIDVQLTKKQTLLLATLVPDELLLLDKFDSSEPRRFVGVLLMADVSGYTSLSEKYCNSGKGGIYRLTVTLNTYLGSLVEIIYSHGGDILKFAGDAFLALWKTDKRSFLSHTIHSVIACALIIQHSYASYETDVKVSLRVKLAISAGNLLFAPIGKGIDMNYVIVGLPVIEAKVAESVCASGEVKLTPNTWGHCYSRNYDHYIHEDGHVTIKAILYDPHEKDVTKPFIGLGAKVKQPKRFIGVENLPEIFWDSQKKISSSDLTKMNEELEVRKNILIAEERNIGPQIRKFMIRPILTQIDAHQPLEYLTEMRQISILFMTLKPRKSPFAQLITIVNNTYQITCDIVYRSMGCVNKIILFDKEVMILVVFGLRGFKHESEAQAALKCAYSIKKSVSALDGVLEVSIGVTTGQVYCGVIGHPLRREFTVIGAVVNKAARLMCKFNNKITCDETTFFKSKMSTNGFTLQPNTELKGIKQPGKIYEYSEDIRVKQLYEIPTIPPILGQIEEIEYYQSWLKEGYSSFRDFDALLLIGESRIGKTRILEWMARLARNDDLNVCYLTLSSIHSATPYLALSQIVDQLLGLTEPIIGFMKEEKIVKLLKLYNEDLCYLNKIIKVRFAYHENIYTQNEIKRKDKAKVMFSSLISALTETYVIFIDDLQNLDASSWEFICLIFFSMNIFTVMSVTRGKFSTVHNWLYSVFINNSIRKIVLGPLAPSLIPALACQILDVDAVPKDLCDALLSKCNGMPGLVESFLIHLFSSGALEIKNINQNEIIKWQDDDLQFPEPELLHPQSVDPKLQDKLDELLENDQSESFNIAIVTCKEELKTNIFVQNLDALIMIQIDSLTPYQQLLLKIASVIGNILSRELLENIMYENNWLITARAIKRLFDMRVFTCATASSKWYRNASTSSGFRNTSTPNVENLVCECNFEYDADINENLPKYAFCKVIKFMNKNSRKTCYDLLPLNQKKEFHSRIVNYLENNTQKCPYCGGTVMIVQSLVDLPDIHYNSEPNSNYSVLNDVDDISSDESKDTADNLDINTYVNTKTRSQNVLEQKQSSDQDQNNEPKKSNSDSVIAEGSPKSIMNTIKMRYASILKSKSNVEEKENYNQRASKRVTMTKNFSKRNSFETNSITIFDQIREVIEAESLKDWHNLGVVDSQDNLNEDKFDTKSKRKSFNLTLEEGVSQINFRKCTCADLHVAIYEQLIHHAVQAELKVKAIYFMIMYSYLNLLGNNFDVIFPKLEDAEKMCLQNIENLDVTTKKQYLGKIYSIRAATCLLSGKLTAAKIELDRALKIYKINLDKMTDMLLLNSIIKCIKMKRQKYRLHTMSMKSDSVFCLNVAILLNSSLGDDRSARCAATRALQIIQEAECPLVDICDAYSSALQVEIRRGVLDTTIDIEKMAYQTLKQLPRRVRADELYAIGKLFSECFKVRIMRGELVSAVRAGFRVLTISRYLQADNICLDIIPDLFYILLARRRIDEAINVMHLTLSLGHNYISQDSETWYYALCIDLILDAGFQKECPRDISRFAEFSISKGRAGGPGRRRLIIGLWSYWLRANSDKKAKIYETEALSWVSNEDECGSMTSLFSSLRLAEAMLESLAKKVDDLKKVVDLMELRSIADRELTRLEKDAREMHALFPRWLLLKGNTLKLSGRHTAATNAFNQALDESRRIHNRLEEALARAALSTNPVFWTQNARKSVFIDWRLGIEHANSSWHQLMYKLTDGKS